MIIYDINSVKHKLIFCSHVRRFPRYVSHYSRKENPNKSLTRTISSVAEMCGLYKHEHSLEHQGTLVSYGMYLDIFNHDFNIGFKMPSSDTCKTCDEWLVKNEDEIPLVIVSTK